MMQLSKNLRSLIIIGIVLVAAFVAYSVFFNKQVEPALSQSSTAVEAAIDQDLVAVLFQLRAITLDDAIFSDPVFRSLTDFGQELVPEPIGRVNPFAPLGQ